MPPLGNKERAHSVGEVAQESEGEQSYTSGPATTQEEKTQEGLFLFSWIPG